MHREGEMCAGIIFWYLCWSLIKGAGSAVKNAGGPIPHTPPSLDRQVLLDLSNNNLKKESQEETTAVMPLRCGHQHSVNLLGFKIITIIITTTATSNSMRASCKFCTSESKAVQTSVLAHRGRQPSPTMVQNKMRSGLYCFLTQEEQISLVQISYLGWEVVSEGMSPKYHICSRNTCGEIQYWTSVEWYPFFSSVFTPSLCHSFK